MNPILPLSEFIPDVEAHQFSDGRLYLYGSMDICGEDRWCSKQYKVFSTDDMKHWSDHGISFSTDQQGMGVFAGSILYAPDCIEKNGKYYLYFCTAELNGKGLANGEGVAVSDNPWGSFKEVRPIPLANEDAIDPAIFIDDDGAAYLYWGQFRLRGARLKENMREIDEATLNTNIINEDSHGFHEGSSMRKRGDIYYLVYADDSSGAPTRLSYAMGKSPLGPFEQKGIIIDNIGCDPSVWNNHGSIAEFNGQWYVFYHRQTHNSKFSRRVCVEPITFQEDGSINRVEMTTQGIDGPLQPEMKMDAGRACQLSMNAFIQRDGKDEYIQAVTDGDSAIYKYYAFDGAQSSFTAIVRGAKRNSQIEIRLDHIAGELLGVCQIPPAQNPEQWTEVSCKIKKANGKHGLCLVFRGSGKDLFQIQKFWFYQ
ncbi:MAG TPA: hypothetical protein DD391_01760 [Clostridiales bacterium]|nr:carbohydrate-binding protein [Clostridiales bacterium]HBL81323.1 hypothetical protein [Clostridiales bacterium]